ncbi:uncharacterized protein LOC105913856 isoform X1 [Setaria italica]|uniref:uncharacterized protein LOC105913856 isoform X1 n=1 Tax=Setaria italica TaxID=4555 RepID=UPI000BE53921|nr:uncharacterized protein LOC105913856 isoform X1 [Setaria italica]
MSNQTLHEYYFALRNIDHISDANATLMLLSNRTKDLWKSPRGTVIRIEVLVVVVVFLQLFLIACGSRRRRSRNFFIQKGVLAAYTLSPSLVSYTLGSIQSSAIKSGMYSMWAISLYILFGCADSITAYSLTDNSQLMRQLYQCFLGYLYVGLIIPTTLDPDKPSGFLGVRFFPLICLVGVAATYFIQRLGACRMASESWLLNKVIADYMYQEHTISREDYDPATMTGYHYLVECRLYRAYTGRAYIIGDGKYVTHFRSDPSDPDIIDLDKVWRNDDLSPDLKDACLSFSLFHLLRRRFFGFECGESSQPKTRDLVFKGLLAKKKEEENDDGGASAAIDYDWVFKVIEIELAFMYDFFFTMYAAIYYGSRSMARYVLQLVSAILTVVIAFLTAGGRLRPPPKGMEGSVIVDTTAADVYLTVAILVCISFLQVVQVMYYPTTIWGRVSFACQRIKRKGCCMGLKDFLVKIGLWVSSCRWHHHEQKLGQYSLLESLSNFSSQSKLTKFLVILQNAFLFWLSVMEGFVLQGRVIPNHVRSIIRKPGEPAELVAAVKKALVQSLERTHRHGNKLTNGALSLSSSGAYELLWACSLELRQGLELGSVSLQQKENQVCVILTWHISTCYCDREFSASGSAITNEHYEVATRLSKYCAYLVAFAPKLLPGHHYDTWIAFMLVAEEALKQQQSQEAGDEETIYRKGLRLGEQLKNMQADHCWEVLAGFWAEMLLYLAPSNNVKEHVECLAKGGEFITHLWALLTHAGILDRGQSDVADIENNGGNQPASRPTNRDGPSTGKSCADCGTSSR